MEAATAVRPPHTLSTLHSTGDIKTIWNPNNADEVAEARKQFDSLRGRGFTIFRVGDDGNKHTRMDSFDPSAERLIAVPRVVGG
jgi:hypothetical protein